MNQPRMASPGIVTVSSSSTVSEGPFGAVAPYRLRRELHHRGYKSHPVLRINGRSPSLRVTGGSRYHRCSNLGHSRRQGQLHDLHPNQNRPRHLGQHHSQHLSHSRFHPDIPMGPNLVIVHPMKSALLVLPVLEPRLVAIAVQERRLLSPGATAEIVRPEDRGDHRGCVPYADHGGGHVSGFSRPWLPWFLFWSW